MLLSCKKLFSRIHSSSLVYLFLLVIVISCNNNPVSQIEIEPGWNQDGIFGSEITVLEQDGKNLLVGTEDGLFLRTEQGIKNLGLKDREIRGIARLLNQSLLAGAINMSNYTLGDVTLFRSETEGKTWQPYINNYGGDERKYTEFLRGPAAANPPTDTIFVNDYGSIAYSTNGGEFWELINGQWNSSGTGLPILFYLDPFYPERIWVGGVTGISQAYLFKSNNYKENNWVNVSDGLNDDAEAIAYDVITHPENQDWVLVGLGGAFEPSNKVKKSLDGGQSWQLSLEKTGVHTFVRSRRNPDIIYASGRDSSGKLYFATTTNFGETWEKEIFESGPSQITTNDLGVLMINGTEVLFLGTDKGLFSYKFQ